MGGLCPSKSELIQVIGSDAQSMLKFRRDFIAPSPDAYPGCAQGVKCSNRSLLFDQPLMFERIC